MTTLLFGIYCLGVFVASLVGGFLPGIVRLTHFWMQVVLSFVAGLMLGVAMLHMLPHAAAEVGSLDLACGAGLVGLLAMFFLIRVLHVHHHDPAGQVPELTAHEHDHGPCGHDHGESEPDEHAHCHIHRHSWFGVFFGLGVHTLVDGLALAAAVRADAHHGQTGEWLLGIGTFFAILCHKPVDSLSITSVMAAAGWSRSRVQLANILFALLCPVGALSFYFGMGGQAAWQPAAIGCALGFSAGVFLCISLADILPEVQFHIHDKFALSLALGSGVALAYAIGWLEPRHLHQHPIPPSREVRVESQ